MQVVSSPTGIILHSTVTNSIKFCRKGKPTFHTSFYWQVKTSCMNSSQMQFYDYRSLLAFIAVNDQAYIN